MAYEAGVPSGGVGGGGRDEEGDGEFGRNQSINQSINFIYTR